MVHEISAIPLASAGVIAARSVVTLADANSGQASLATWAAASAMAAAGEIEQSE